MKKILLAATVVLLLCTGLLFAQEEDTVDAYVEFNSALGFQIGAIAGNGISYQTWFSENTGVQVAFGVLYFPDSDNNSVFAGYDVLDYSLGAELQYRVYGEDYADWFSAQLYTLAGLNHSGEIERGEYDYDTDTYSANSPYQAHVTLGVGIGIEVIVFRHLSVPFELGYAFTWSPLAGELPEQFNVDLVPQFGFRYRY